MALPKGLIKQAIGTVSPKAQVIEEKTTDNFVDREATVLAVAIPHEAEKLGETSGGALPKSDASPRLREGTYKEGPVPKTRRPIKQRVHYTIHADLIAFAAEAWREYRRADGSRLDSASDYVGELLKLARDRTRNGQS